MDLSGTLKRWCRNVAPASVLALSLFLGMGVANLLRAQGCFDGCSKTCGWRYQTGDVRCSYSCGYPDYACAWHYCGNSCAPGCSGYHCTGDNFPACGGACTDNCYIP